MSSVRISTILLAVFFLPVSALSAFEGSLSFTEAEKSFHEKGQEVLLQEAASCVQQQFDHHTAFYKRYGISPYYGEGSKFGQSSEKKRIKMLKKLGFGPEMLAQMQPNSCVGMALTCLARGFAKAGQADLWKRLKQFTVQNGVSGLALQEGLRRLGWKVLFWNPDLRLNERKAEWERSYSKKNADRYWGFHDEYWNSVRNTGVYLYNKVDDYRLLLNFGKETPATLKNTPFFVGSAHGGYHVFTGTKGKVVEAHSLVEISNSNTLAASPFNPLGGQGPGHGMYHSGLIAVPAQYAR